MSQPDTDRIDTETLRLMRDLCPTKKGSTTAIEITLRGKTVRLTAETRDRINAEIRRRTR
jgi:hypothetical protein